MKMGGVLPFVLFFSYAFSAQQRISDQFVSDRSGVKRYLGVETDAGAWIHAPLCVLKEGFFSFSDLGVVLEIQNIDHAVKKLTVASEAVIFVLCSAEKNHADAYKSENQITLTEIRAYLNGEISEEVVKKKAQKAIKRFFNDSKSFEKCSYSKIEKAQATSVDTLFYGINGVWLVFFPKDY